MFSDNCWLISFTYSVNGLSRSMRSLAENQFNKAWTPLSVLVALEKLIFERDL